MVEQHSEQPRDFSVNPYSGPELRNIRQKIAHLNQTRVSERLGMTRIELGLIEQGKLAPVDGLVIFQNRYLGALQEIITELKNEIENDPRISRTITPNS